MRKGLLPIYTEYKPGQGSLQINYLKYGEVTRILMIKIIRLVVWWRKMYNRYQYRLLSSCHKNKSMITIRILVLLLGILLAEVVSFPLSPSIAMPKFLSNRPQCSPEAHNNECTIPNPQNSKTQSAQYFTSNPQIHTRL